MTGAITEAALVSDAVTTRVRTCRGGQVAFLRRGHGRATHRNNETWRPLMTAADVPDPSGLDVRRAAQAAADKVLTMLGVPIGLTVDRVEDLHDDPGVFISFGMEPGQPESGWSAMLIGDSEGTVIIEVTPRSDPTDMPVPGPIDIETLCLLTDPDPRGGEPAQWTSADWSRGAAVMAALRAAWNSATDAC